MGKKRGVTNCCSSAASHPALATINFTTFTFSVSECDTEHTSHLPLLLGPPLLLRDITSNLIFSHHEGRLLALSQLRGTVFNSTRKRPQYLIQMLRSVTLPAKNSNIENLRSRALISNTLTSYSSCLIASAK